MHRLFSFWDRMTQLAFAIVHLEGLVTSLTVKHLHVKKRIVPFLTSRRNLHFASGALNQNQSSVAIFDMI